MEVSEAGVALIRDAEGLRTDAYLDAAGNWSIGYGHTVDVVPGMHINRKQADQFLMDDIAAAEYAVRTLVDAPLTQGQFDALTSFVFNVGYGNFARSTLLRQLNASDYATAANQFMRWTQGGGRRLSGLVERRAAERERFLAQD